MSRPLDQLTECKICGYVGQIDQHHLIPRRYNGPDSSWNLVGLCRECHQKIESIYTDKVWHFVGLDRPNQSDSCFRPVCGSTSTKRMRFAYADWDQDVGYDFDRFLPVCESHDVCDQRYCKQKGKPHYIIEWDRSKENLEVELFNTMLCKEHSECSLDGCKSHQTVGLHEKSLSLQPRCQAHMNIYDPDYSITRVIEQLSDDHAYREHKIEQLEND